MLQTICLEKDKIQAFCNQNNIEFCDYIKASVLQTYLRFTREFYDYFEENTDMQVLDYIKESVDVYKTIELPFACKVSGDGKCLSIEFKESDLDEVFKESLIRCSKCVVSEMLEKKRIYDVKLVSLEEEKEIYRVSTGEELNCDKTKTWIDFLVEYAKKQPDNTAVVDVEGAITYRELDELSNIIANYLVKQNVKANEFVALQCKRRKEFLIAAAGVNKAGAAYAPVDFEYPQKIREYILENSEAKLVLDDDAIKQILSEYAHFKDKEINEAKPDNLAYMIYTSGTTGNPKGVMIRHKSITCFGAWTIPHMGLDSSKRNLVHASFSFDASVMDFLAPLMAGGAVHIADEKTRMNLKATADYIRENGITGMVMCYSLARELLSRHDINPDYVVIGGEPFVPFRKVPYRLVNAYGPTEFTVLCTTHEVMQDKDYMPPIGGPAPGTIGVVTDCFMKPVPLGVPGELCLSGDQIAKGYCNNEAATKRGFVTLENGLECYRSGDLVKYNEDGELEFLGRIDRQVKHRGFRIEPAQIENRVLQYEDILECAVAVKKINNIKRLCLYYVAPLGINLEKLKDFLATELADYMMPEAYMAVDDLPKTRNGKADYASLPEICMENVQSEYVAPQSPLEKLICRTVSKVLNIEKIGMNDDIMQYGVDSLTCMELIQELDLPLLEISDIYDSHSVKDIIKTYKEKIGQIGKEAKVENAEELEYPLLGAQVHFYRIHEKFPHNTSCNIHCLYKMGNTVKPEKLALALDKVVKAHKAFGNRFFKKNGNVYQTYESDYIKKTEIENISEAELESMLDKLVEPYDIFGEPLYRIRIFITELHTYLFGDFHHLIFDGYSVEVFWRDVISAYNGLDVKQDEYYKYLYNKQLTAELRKNEEIKINKACIMPFDFKERRYVPYKEREDVFEISIGMNNETIEKLCRKYEVSANAFFMGCYLLAMYKEIGEKHLTVSWIYNGRDMSFAENCVGLMINLLFINCEMNEEMSFEEYFRQVKNEVQSSLSGSTNNGYAFRNLLEEPVACFQYRDMMSEKTNEYVCEMIELPNPMFEPGFFWEFEVVNNVSDISVCCVYNNYYYEKETARRFVHQFEKVVTKVAEGTGLIKDV